MSTAAPLAGASPPPARRIGMFGRPVEIAMMLVPALALLLVAGELVVLFPVWTRPEYRVARFLSDVVALGTIHSVMSWSLVLGLPELRAWIRELAAREGRLRFWGKQLALVGAIFGFFFYLVAVPKDPDDAFKIGVLATSISFFGVRHWTYQTMGISLQYNWKVKGAEALTDEERATFAEAEQMEKRLFRRITAFAVAGALLLAWRKSFKLDWMAKIAYVLLAASAHQVGQLLLNAARLPKIDRTNKVAYLCRMLLVPLQQIAFSADLAMRALHGLEFLATTGKMAKNSSSNRKGVVLLVGLTIGMLLVAGTGAALRPVIFGPWIYGSTPLPKHTFFALLVALNATSTFYHYYADSMMFKMHDEVTRRRVGPLLKG
jgi:hypothetical protein